jgi:ribonuclease P protein component
MVANIGRLKRKKDFNQLKRWGKAHSSRHITLRASQLASTDTLVTVVASQKVSKKAVVRNTVKRRLRAALLPHTAKLRSGQAIMIIARKSSITAAYADIKSELALLLNKAKLIN